MPIILGYYAHYAKPGTALGYYRTVGLTGADRVQRLFHGLWVSDEMRAAEIEHKVASGVFTLIPHAPACVVVEARILVPRDLLEGGLAKRFDVHDEFEWRKQIAGVSLARVSYVRYTIGGVTSHSVESSRSDFATKVHSTSMGASRVDAITLDAPIKVAGHSAATPYGGAYAARAALEGRTTDESNSMGGAIAVKLGLADLHSVHMRERSFDLGFVAAAVKGQAVALMERRENEAREKREREKQAEREKREREMREAAKQREREERLAAEEAERARLMAERAARGDVSDLDDAGLRALLRRRREEAKAKAVVKGDGS